MAGLLDFLFQGQGGGLLGGMGQQQPVQVDPNMFAARAMGQNGGGIFGGIRGALDQIADPQGEGRQRALQNWMALRQMGLKETAANEARSGFGEFLGAPAAPAPAMPQQGGGQFAPAIAGIESGGKYDALGPVINRGAMAGDRAYGKYQVMGSNIPKWTQEVLGQPMTPEQFVANPQAQDAVFKAKFGEYAQKYGPEGAARAWFAGEGGMNDPNRSDQLGTTVQGYGQKFAQNAGLQPQVAGGKPDAQGVYGPNAVMLPQTAQSDPATLPPTAQPAQGFAIPGQAQPQGQQPQLSAKAQGLIRMLRNPYLDEGQRALGMKLLEGEMGQTKPTDDIREFEYAKRQGFTGTLEQWMQRKRSGAGEYGLQPIWGTKGGKTTAVQLGKGGEAIESKLPEGFEIARDPQKFDLGTHWGILDPQTRQIVNMIPKNIEGKESAEERGKAQGQAQVNLGGVTTQADLALKTIEQIRSHPGKSFGTGLTGVLPGIPGTAQKGFVALVDQAKGQTFLTAFERLKGAGAITEIEGAKATQAIGRLDRAQKSKDFDAALKDLEDVIKVGVERAKQKAAGSGGSGAAPADPLGIR